MASAIPFKMVKFTPNDFEDYYKLTSSAQVMAMITEKPMKEVESQSNFNRLLERNDLHEDLGSFKILQSSTDEFIGLAKLALDQPEGREVEIGFMLLPDYWGKGIASEATRILIEKARKQPQLRKIRAIIDPQNKASRKILVNHQFVSEFVGEIDGLPGEVLVLLLS